MKAIFHLHTRYSGDALISIDFLLDYCIKNGIDVLFITEHNNMDSYPVAMEYIRKHNLSIKLVPCEEIATTQGEVIGLFLKESIPAGLSLKETVDRILAQKALIAVPHPFDSFRKERMKDTSNLEFIQPFIHLVEIFNARSSPANNEKARLWAQKHGILPIWGADAHFKGELGNCILEIPPFDTPDSFLEAIAKAKVLKKRRSFLGILKSGLLKKWKRYHAARNKF